MTNDKKSNHRFRATIQQLSDSPQWKPPQHGCLKANVDAAVPINDGDDQGTFVRGKVMSFNLSVSVFEGEAVGVREALSWIHDHGVTNGFSCNL